MNLTEEFKQFLYNEGANLVGIGNITDVKNARYPIGVSIALALPTKIIRDLFTAPTMEYYHMYHDYNQKLNTIASSGERFLQNLGYRAWAQTTERVKINEQFCSKLPHKTIATHAGLGWIGKNNLLVTQQFGSAIRISSLLTDAPLKCDDAFFHSNCQTCDVCVQQCPAKALKGSLWEAGMPREKIVDVESCYRKQLEIMVHETGIETDLCGKCFAVCIYTQKYLERTES